MCIFDADAYTTADVDYRWKGGDDQGIEIVSAEMAQFDLLGVKTRTKSQTNSKGEKIELGTIKLPRILNSFSLINGEAVSDEENGLTYKHIQVYLPRKCLRANVYSIWSTE